MKKLASWSKYFVLVLPFIILRPVYAANDILPPTIADLISKFPGGAGLLGFITSRVQLFFVLALIVLILAAVIYTIMAAFTYVRSQGESGKIEEAQKSIKAVWMGLASLFVGIVGMVLVFVFFNVAFPSTVQYETCLLAPGSEGCTVCKDDGIVEGNLCDFCEDEYAVKAIKGESYEVNSQCSE